MRLKGSVSSVPVEFNRDQHDGMRGKVGSQPYQEPISSLGQRVRRVNDNDHDR